MKGEAHRGSRLRASNREQAPAGQEMYQSQAAEAEAGAEDEATDGAEGEAEDGDADASDEEVVEADYEIVE